MKKILVVNINWLGDAIFSTPVFKILKDAYPQASITCLCPRRVKDVMDYCPWVDQVMIIDEQKNHFWPWKKLKLIFQLRKEKFDAAVLIHRSMTRALIVFLAGIPIRVGYSKARWLLTQSMDFPDNLMHRSQGYVKVVEALGLDSIAPLCQLRLKEDDVNAGENLLREHKVKEGQYVVFHPGGNWDLKRWPIKNWIELAKVIHQEFSMTVVLTGSKADQEICADIAKQAGKEVVDLSSQTRLGESLVIFKKSRIVISADSGPLHLANSVGSRTLGLFGPTRPEITGPRGLGHTTIMFHDVGCNKAPCYHLDCKDNVCMKSITVEDVCRELKRIFSP